MNLLKQILYVDDDADAPLLLRLMLREATLGQYQISCARTVTEGLGKLQQQPYDLVVLSWFYEDGDGIDLCRQIRQAGVRTPILFYSGEARAVYKELALQSGAQAYLVKPDDLARLVETIEQLAHGERS